MPTSDCRTPVELGSVQQTLLIPLLARALETKRSNRKLEDTKAVEIVDSTEYNFEKFPDNFALRAMVGRTLMMDEDVRSYMERFPDGVVVEVGCGLNTRFSRLDNGTIKWFNLDLPDVIDMRRNFFLDSERCKMIAASFTDPTWHTQVAQARPHDNCPVCFVCEASIVYISTQKVQSSIRSIARHFDRAVFVTDTTGSDLVRSQDSNPLMKHLSRDSYFVWGCDDPREIEGWTGYKWHLARSRTLLEMQDEFWADAPLAYRVIRRYIPFVARKMIGTYRLNVFSTECQ